LVLDAVTVRNLELIEPLFAGTDAGVTLFRSIDAAITPMGKRLLRAWLLRRSARSGGNQCRVSMPSKLESRALSPREELRRALDGVFDLERLLSRVTLETRIRGMCWLWRHRWRKFRQSKRGGRLTAERAERLARIARRTQRPARADRNNDCAGTAVELCRWRVIAAGV